MANFASNTVSSGTAKTVRCEMLKSFDPTLIGADIVLPPQALSARASSMPSANNHRTEQRNQVAYRHDERYTYPPHVRSLSLTFLPMLENAPLQPIAEITAIS